MSAELAELQHALQRRPHEIDRLDLKLATLASLGKLAGPNIRDLLAEIGRDLSAVSG